MQFVPKRSKLKRKTRQTEKETERQTKTERETRDTNNSQTQKKRDRQPRRSNTEKLSNMPAGKKVETARTHVQINIKTEQTEGEMIRVKEGSEAS